MLRNYILITDNKKFVRKIILKSINLSLIWICDDMLVEGRGVSGMVIC